MVFFSDSPLTGGVGIKLAVLALTGSIGIKLAVLALNWCGGIMIQCKDCELYEAGEDGKRTFKCDPFSNIKEAECLAKWQLIRLDMLVASYQGMLQWYGKLAPIQDKLFKYMEKEIGDIDESEKWKVDEDEEDEDPETDY